MSRLSVWTLNSERDSSASLHYAFNDSHCTHSDKVVLTAAGQLRPLRHHIYRGAVVGVRGAAVGARGAVVGVRGAAVGNIGMHTYIRHICAPVRACT